MLERESVGDRMREIMSETVGGKVVDREGVRIRGLVGEIVRGVE